MESSLKGASTKSRFGTNGVEARKKRSAEVRSCGDGGPGMGVCANLRDRQMDRAQMSKREGGQPPQEKFQDISSVFEDRDDGKDAHTATTNSSQGHHNQNVNEDNHGDNGAVGTSLGSVADIERMASHSKATTSLRCGFQWLSDKLRDDKEGWIADDENEANENIDEFTDYAWHYKYKAVPRSRLRHVIGRGGRMLQKIESFLGVFAFVREDASGDPKVVFVGQRHAIVLGDFIVNMILMGHYTIMESLARAGF